MERGSCGKMDMVQKRRSICGLLGWSVTLIALYFFALCILSSCGEMPVNSEAEHNSEPGASDHDEFDTSDSLGPNAAPLQFYYHGNFYCYHGRVVYSLPAECKLAGQVNNVAGTSRVVRSNADFDGNADGYLYIDAGNDEAAYFQWKEWDEAAGGREPYLICVLEEPDQQ